MALLVDLDAAKLHDELLARRPADARHDSALCPFCIDNARAAASPAPQASAVTAEAQRHDQDPTVPGIPPAEGRSGAHTSDRTEYTEGGTPSPMSTDTAQTLSKETHDALLAKAVTDATKATDAALAAKSEELTQIAAQRDELQTKVETLTADNARLNGELDSAQVAQRTAEDKAAKLEADIAERDQAAEKARLATERASQARNLGVWTEEQITEKAERWAGLPETDWADRIEEWRHLGKTGAAPATDAASAMTGTTGSLTKEPATDTAKKTGAAARRAALGLDD